MLIELRYFDDCPNWLETDRHLRELTRDRDDITLKRRPVETDTEAQCLGFHGSPSIVIDGVDAFPPGEDTPTGLSCRVYVTPEGVAGAPTLEQLRTVIDARSGRGCFEVPNHGH